MKTLKIALAAATAAILLPSPALAAKYIIAGVTPNSYTFGNNGGIANGLFTDTFNFTITNTGGGTTGVLATGVGAADIDFVSAFISGPGITGMQAFLPQTGDPFESLTASFAALAGSYTVTVNGRSHGPQGTYTGSLSVLTAAVPEPATWAMMIGGFGLMGGAMRRRRATKVAFATA